MGLGTALGRGALWAQALTFALAGLVPPGRASADEGMWPLHQPPLAWAARDTVAAIPQAPNDYVMLRYVRMK